MKMYRIHAVYTPPPCNGWQPVAEQLPTFYLHPDAQGITSERQAAQIAADMFAGLVPEGGKLAVTATLVES